MLDLIFCIAILSGIGVLISGIIFTIKFIESEKDNDAECPSLRNVVIFMALFVLTIALHVALTTEV